jgi:hypothetical protein
MASGFPGSIDNFTDPLSNSPLTSPNHATLHADVNDAVEKIETYMGLVKIIPTGTSAGNTLGADGTITIGTAVSNVVVTNCFSALYDNYLVLMQVDSNSNSNQSIQVRFRNSGGTDSTSDYRYCYIYSNYSTGGVSAANTATGTGFDYALNFIGTQGGVTAINIYRPFFTQVTLYSSSSARGDITGTSSGFHNVAASYPSMNLVVGGGNFTGGKVRVYGYRN